MEVKSIFWLKSPFEIRTNFRWRKFLNFGWMNFLFLAKTYETNYCTILNAFKSLKTAFPKRNDSTGWSRNIAPLILDKKVRTSVWKDSAGELNRWKASFVVNIPIRELSCWKTSVLENNDVGGVRHFRTAAILKFECAVSSTAAELCIQTFATIPNRLANDTFIRRFLL